MPRVRHAAPRRSRNQSMQKDAKRSTVDCVDELWALVAPLPFWCSMLVELWYCNNIIGGSLIRHDREVVVTDNPPNLASDFAGTLFSEIPLIFDTPPRPRSVSNYTCRGRFALACIVNATQVPNRAANSFLLRAYHLPASCAHWPATLCSEREIEIVDHLSGFHKCNSDGQSNCDT